MPPILKMHLPPGRLLEEIRYNILDDLTCCQIKLIYTLYLPKFNAHDLDYLKYRFGRVKLDDIK